MSEEVLAPMAGKIITMNVEVGSEVEEDEEIIIIEAMKMETPIYAPCDGKVTKILKKEGDEIEEDDQIAIIE
ncbi:MAG: acetyl-CoA carboxylase biotin carboxyl carrier protein subunit [Desulfobacteraceae bacterium]|nr:acetyl-CoA carboxylase biotin carboxyl carrier protein subunit [Desulfobacteraceae bacterium]